MANGFINQASFDAALQQARAQAQASARKISEKSANQLAARLKTTIPLGPDRNGHIRDTITVSAVDADTWEVSIGGGSFIYAGHLEFGHKADNGVTIPPEKVFYPAVKIQNKKHGRAIRALFRRVLRGGGFV